MNANTTLGRGPYVRWIRHRTLWLGLLALVGGCDSPQPESTSAVAETAAPGDADPVEALRRACFLSLTESDVAGEWLAIQAHRDDPSYRPKPAEIAEYERRIGALAKHTLEDRRMVANRTVQTRDLLAEQNIRESLGTLLDGMLALADAGVVGNYGAYCQWYVNLRQGGLGHQEALQRMIALKHSR